MSHRERLWWAPLAAAAVVMLARSSPRARVPRKPSGAPAEGPGDNDVISYVVSTDGTIYVRTQATDVEWGTPKLQEKVLPDFRGMLAHWGPLIDDAGVDFRLPSATIAGVMWAESNGNPSLVSPAGACGLMQVMPMHFAANEPKFDPRTNIRKGAQLLAGARAGFRDLVQMASAYNAGGPQGMNSGPWTNDVWLRANRNPALTSRWGYVSEPGYIDRVVAASNSYLALKGQA